MKYESQFYKEMGELENSTLTIENDISGDNFNVSRSGISEALFEMQTFE